MKDWKESLTFFLGRYLPTHRGMSLDTLESYGTALKFLVGWLKTRGRPVPPPCALTVQDVLGFLEWLEEGRGNSTETRNLRWAALQSFWKAMKIYDPENDRAFGGPLRRGRPSLRISPRHRSTCPESLSSPPRASLPGARRSAASRTSFLRSAFPRRACQAASDLPPRGSRICEAPGPGRIPRATPRRSRARDRRV